MEQLERARKKLKTAHEKLELDYINHTREQDELENKLLERFRILDEKKHTATVTHGDVNASDNDRVEINAGGKIVAARRGTLCQLKGTRLEALFCGRWDKKLQRDNSGRIFLDVKGDCFQAIVDYLNELVISGEDDIPKPPMVDDEHKQYLDCQLAIFGINVPPQSPGSDIVKQYSQLNNIHQWLKEDGSDGALELLYRSSRDGLSNKAFHNKCDNKGQVFPVSDYYDPRKQKELSSNPGKKVPVVNLFTKAINEAINEKWVTLHELEEEVSSLEEIFNGNGNGEEQFVDSFASGDKKDVIALDVSGTMMVTRRATLQIIEGSVLAQQFDDTKWTAQGNSQMRVKEWSTSEVCNWVAKIEGLQEDVSRLFEDNSINGPELIALDKDGLQMIGVKRAGTTCLLLKEIRLLGQKSQDVSTLIEHSPYCFGKILDYLRMKHLHSIELIKEPSLPSVCESQKERLRKVVKYYFPGMELLLLAS